MMRTLWWWLFVALVAVAMSGPKVAHAAFSATPAPAGACTVAPCFQYRIDLYDGVFRDTKQATCDQFLAVRKPYYPAYTGHYIVIGPLGTYGQCVMWASINGTVSQIGGGNIVGNTVTAQPAFTCPANSTLSGNLCTCGSTFNQDGATCVAKSPASDAAVIAKGLNLVGAPLVGTGGASLRGCYAGYVMTGSGSASNGSTINEIYPPFTSTGETCTDVPVTPNTSGLNCPASSYTGTVNGVSVCVPGVANISSGPTVAAPPSGTASAPTSGIVNAPPGTLGSSTSTSCVAGNCTTNTDYKGAGGVSTGTATSTESQASYCSKNPGASVCAAFDECSKNPDRLGCLKLGDPVAGPGLSTSEVNVSISPVAFASVETCPADIPMHFSVMGHAFTPSVSYASLCSSAAAYVRPVLLLISLAGAAFIFVGGLKT